MLHVTFRYALVGFVYIEVSCICIHAYVRNKS